MTKSEAKTIEQRAGKALALLAGVNDAGPAIPWSSMSPQVRELVQAAVAEARSECAAILAMAQAEFGRR